MTNSRWECPQEPQVLSADLNIPAIEAELGITQSDNLRAAIDEYLHIGFKSPEEEAGRLAVSGAI